MVVSCEVKSASECATNWPDLQRRYRAVSLVSACLICSKQDVVFHHTFQNSGGLTALLKVCYFFFLLKGVLFVLKCCDIEIQEFIWIHSLLVVS